MIKQGATCGYVCTECLLDSSLPICGTAAAWVVCAASTARSPETPLVAVDLADERGRWFRVVPAEMWGVENNVPGNMFFREFADATDPDGVFRGFPA